MPASTLVICNPKAGSSPPRFSRLEVRLEKVLGDLELTRTRKPRDASRIAREAIRSGVKRIVVGGGDGTLLEVVTGILDAGLGKEVEVGFLPLGTGCDFARSMNLPRSLSDSIDLLGAGESRSLDAGRVQFVERGGESRTTCFINEASFGLSGLTVDWMNRYGRKLGPRLGFALAAGQSVLRYPTPDLVVLVDGEEVHSGSTPMVVVANGSFFGGGMKVAPDASLDDGLFDVVIVGALSRSRLLANFPALYRGTHTTHPAVSIYRGSRVQVLPKEDSSVLLDADGEALGSSPASIEMLPSALTFFGLPRKSP